MDTWLRKADVLYRQGRYDLARQVVAQQLQLNPNCTEAHALDAMCLSFQNQPKLALAAAERAVSLSPDLGYAHYVAAWVLHHYDANTVSVLGFSTKVVPRPYQVRLARAETFATEALRLDPKNAGTLGLLACIHNGLNDVAGCLRYARQGLAIDPASPICLLAQALALRGAPSAEAIEASSRLVAALRDVANSHPVHANNLLVAGRRNEAMPHIAEAVRLNPNLQIVQQVLLESLRARYPWARIFVGYFG